MKAIVTLYTLFVASLVLIASGQACETNNNTLSNTYTSKVYVCKTINSVEICYEVIK